MSTDRATRTIQFGPFQLDLQSAELFRTGHKVRLPGQPFLILALLLENAGGLVTREELRQKLWSAETFVDFEHGLNNAMQRLREALDDSAEKPRYIETLPRRGYRFIAEVKRPHVSGGDVTVAGPAALSVVGGSSATLPVAVSEAAATSMLSLWGKRRMVWLASAACALLCTVLLIRFARRRPDLPKQPIRSLVVLPLNNLSGDASRDYFAAGVTEQLTTELGRMENVRVISRTSADHYKGTTKTLPQIALELGADAVVEGAVAQSDDRVRITVQLIRASSDEHLWARAYEGKMEDILQMQDDVARIVAEQVRGRLSAREQLRTGVVRKVKPEAYQLYLQGLALMRADNGLDSKALELMQRSIAADPSYGPAYARESEAYDYLGSYFAVIPLNEARTKQRAAAVRALELDPLLSEAHQAMAEVKQNDWDWQGAEEEFRLATAENPNNAEAHNDLAGLLMTMGRPAESLAEAEISVRVDPLAPYIRSMYAWCLEHAGHHDEAVRQFRKAMEIDPQYAIAHYLLGDAFDNQQDFTRAHVEYARAAAMAPGEPKYMSTLGYSFGKIGDRKKATAILNELLTRQPQTHADDIASVYAGLGDKEHALRWLENAYDQHFPEAMWDGISPTLRSLHGDPRFRDLMRRVNVPVIPPS